MPHRPLLTDRRFWPMFWTQFAGAFNDNLFKNGLVLMVTYGTLLFGHEVAAFGLPARIFNPVTGLVFILPFFLFSAQAGQLADRVRKNRLMRVVKLAEIGIMSAGALAFVLAVMGHPNLSASLLVVILFFMGLQSTVFGPAKYGILPQLLDDKRLVGGNALIELGTYLAILTGTILAGVAVQIEGGLAILAGTVVVVSVIGYLLSRLIVDTPAQSPDLHVALDPITPTWQIAKITVANPTIYRSILGISWFWAMGSALLILFPTYTSEVLSASPTIATLFLALFSIGIGAGSMLCERLSRDGLELGLVPIGAVGLSVFCLDLYFVGQPWPAPADGTLVGLSGFFSHFAGWRIAADLFLLATAGGFFIVPLYTLIQLRAPDDKRSRIIAGNNIINSAFMVTAAATLAVTAMMGVPEPTMFLVLAVLNLVCAAYIFWLIPEFLLRFIAWMISNVMYRLDVQGLDNVPREGPALLVCNHVSYVDWLIVGGAIKRPLRFVMWHRFFDMPLISTLFRAARVIPICSAKENPEVLATAMDRIAEELEAGWTVCIFPEGGLTRDGELLPFRGGVERIIERTPVPVIPMAMNGLWGSYFSRVDGRAMKQPLRRGVMSRLWLTIEAPIPASEVSAEGLREVVQGIRDRRPER